LSAARAPWIILNGSKAQSPEEDQEARSEKQAGAQKGQKWWVRSIAGANAYRHRQYADPFRRNERRWAT
jgi:hypothetical protein